VVRFVTKAFNGRKRCCSLCQSEISLSFLQLAIVKNVALSFRIFGLRQ